MALTREEEAAAFENGVKRAVYLYLEERASYNGFWRNGMETFHASVERATKQWLDENRADVLAAIAAQRGNNANL